MNKGLEALKNILNNDKVFTMSSKEYSKNVSVIENELKDKEKQDHYIETLEDRLNNLETTYTRKNKVLEIIKETFKITFDDEEQTITIDDCYSITFHNKKKYDLLKEVLNYGK